MSQAIPDPDNQNARLLWEGEMFRLLAENVKDYAIFVVDGERRITTWSKGAEFLLGYSEAEIIGRELDIFFTPEDLAIGAPEEEIREATAIGRGEDDRWHVRKDGSRFWCSGVLTPLRNEAGELQGFAKIMRDLTQKKLAEDKLAASEARFRTLLDANILGVATTHADGRVLEANDEYLRMLGHTRQELLAGETFWSKRTPHEYLPLDETALAQAAQDGACTPYEKAYERHSDGVRVPVQIAFATLPEQPDQFIVYAVDLSEVHKVREELRQINRNKDEFLATLGHELRNPLAPMLNAVHILRHSKRREDEGIATNATLMIERQVMHMTRLVDDLLEVARATLGKVDLKPDELELHRVVASAAENVGSFMQARMHKFHVSVAPEPIWVHADPVRVEQMLTNLLNNAAKFMDPGGLVWLEARQEDGMAVLTISDSGIGMEADALSRVFEPFTQAQRGHAHTQGGLGIGLTLVRRFAELHGGSVSAESAGPGSGSTFTLKLPVLTDTPALRAQAYATTTQEGRVRVLVVDDNADAADSLRQVLELSGHKVLVAHTGPTGLEQARVWLPEVVLLDIGLPGMDGYQVAQAIRREPQLKTTVLAAMTGYGQPSDVERTLQAGFDRHLIKPVDPSKVFEVLALAEKSAHWI